VIVFVGRKRVCSFIQSVSFNHELLDAEMEEEVQYLSDCFNRGKGSLSGVASVAIVARLFSNFFLSLPEPLVPDALWPLFKAAVNQSDELKKLAELQQLCVQLPSARKTLLVAFLDLIALLDKRKAFASSFEYLSAAVARPPERSAVALAVGEVADSSKIMTYLVKLTPFEKK
jgi:hypothetical protein